MNKDTAILYVEDDPGSRKVMRMVLRNVLGIVNLNIFENSENFYARVEAITPKPDLILLDIHLEPYDGFTMLKILRESADFGTTRVVALTASVMNEEIQQLKSVGFDGVIAKPVNVDTLPGLLQRIMDGESIWTVMK
ncbi:MAG: response regulator [Anaerolineae bacterium]|nr:response regulator [Anaerolineae bacterium]